MSEEDPEIPNADELVDVYLAKKSADDLTSYLERGRSLRDVTDEVLGQKFSEGVTAWSKDLRNGSRALTDIKARPRVLPRPKK